MDSKHTHNLTHKKKSLKEYIRGVEDNNLNIVEEDGITELGQFSILSSSKYSLRRHTCVLDSNTSTYVGLNEESIKEENELDDVLPEEKNLKQKIESLRHLRGFFFIFVYGLFFSLSTIFIKRSYLLAGSDNSIIRYLLQFLIMIIITRAKKINPFGPKEQRILLSVRGFIGQFALVSLHFSVTIIDPSDSIAISNSSLIVASLLAWLFLKEKLTVAHIFSLLLTISGIFLISQPSFIFGNIKKVNTNKQLNLNSTIFNCSLDSLVPNRTIDYVKIINELELKKASSEFNKTSQVYRKCLNLITEQYKIALNESIEVHDNHSIMYDLEHAPVIEKSSVLFYLGILFALIYSFGSGSVQIILKKLCMQKVHFSVATIYASYFGLPSSILISIILFITGISHKHFDLELHFHLLPTQILFSVLSASCGIFAQICLNLALNYEDASKISILKSIDLLFTFVLQFFILKIKPSLLSILGACLILTGSILVISYKIIMDRKTKRKEIKRLELKKNILNSEIIKLNR